MGPITNQRYPSAWRGLLCLYEHRWGPVLLWRQMWPCWLSSQHTPSTEHSHHALEGSHSLFLLCPISNSSNEEGPVWNDRLSVEQQRLSIYCRWLRSPTNPSPLPSHIRAQERKAWVRLDQWGSCIWHPHRWVFKAGCKMSQQTWQRHNYFP